MRILHDLLEYIDEYFYLKDEEEIIIRYGERAALAKEIYDKAVSFVCEDCSLPVQTQGDTSIQVYRRSAKDKWFLDWKGKRVCHSVAGSVVSHRIRTELSR